MLKHALSAVALVKVSITPALAIGVTKSIESTVPPETVWKTIGEFGGIS